MKSSFAAAILLAATAAQAGPPYVTDDPEPVDYQHWEFYVASQDQKVGGDWSGTAPHFELNYGVVPNVQLHLIVPLAYDVPPDGSSQYGLGDTELGVKFRFLQETNYLPQAAVFPLLELPTGDHAENLGNGRVDAFLPLWLQKSWGKWTLYGGGGYGINSFNRGGKNWEFAGAVLQRQVFSNLAIGAELYNQSAAQPDFPNSGTAFNIGAVWDLSEQHHILLTVGRSIQGPTDFQFYLAYQFTFDNSLFHFLNRIRR